MYKEYAIEPAAIGRNWDTFRYLIEKFDIEEGRLISRFPKKWEKLVLAAAKEQGIPDAAFLKIVEKLKRKKETALLKAGRDYDPDLPSWVANALASHGVVPFSGIIVGDNSAGPPTVLIDDVDDDNPVLARSRTADIPRTPDQISGACAMLLSCSNHVDLIDPFFDLRNIGGNYTAPLGLMLTAFSCGGRQNLVARIHYRDHGSRPPEALILRDAGRWTQGLIPEGIELQLIAWSEKVGGEDFHDRFVLTDRGGVQVGAGLAATNNNDHATVALLDTAHAAQIRFKYSDNSTTFDRVGNVVCVSHDGSTSSKAI